MHSKQIVAVIALALVASACTTGGDDGSAPRAESPSTAEVRSAPSDGTCDFDGDGYGDLLQVRVPPAVGGTDSETTRLTYVPGSATGIGAGEVRQVETARRLPLHVGVTAADFDRDGHTDLTAFGDLWPGTEEGVDVERPIDIPGDEGYATEGSLIGGATYPATVGLFDDDEWPDLVHMIFIDNETYGVRVVHGGPDGFDGKTSVVELPGDRDSFGEIAAGDLDDDGRLDLVEYSPAPYYEDQPYVPTQARWIRGTDDGPEEIVTIDGEGLPRIGDVTGDGIDDLVLSQQWRGGGGFTFFRGTPDGPVKVGDYGRGSPGFAGDTGVLDRRDYAFHVAEEEFAIASLTDLTGDGNADAVVSVPYKRAPDRRQGGEIIVMRGTADGFDTTDVEVLHDATTSRTRSIGWAPWVWGTAQLDGRGRPELVVGSGDGRGATLKYQVLTFEDGPALSVARVDQVPSTPGPVDQTLLRVGCAR